MRPLKFTAAALAVALLTPALAVADHDERPEIALALEYLRGQQALDGRIGSGAGADAATAWSAIAFARGGVACGEVRAPGGASLLDAVLAGIRPGLGLLSLERQVLALVACGADPRTAAGFDAVAVVEGAFDGQQLGDPTFLSDDIFGLLALAAAGTTPTSPVMQGVRGYLLEQQQPSGAWGFEPIRPESPNLLFNALFADVDLTAQAIVGLVATGGAAPDPAAEAAVLRGLLFLKLGQSIDGGCQWSPLAPAVDVAFDPAGVLTDPAGGVSSNGASTSWALMALSAVAQDAEGPAWTTPTGANPVAYLLSLQQPDGHFVYQPGVPLFQGDEVMTAHAVVGLSGHTFVA